MPGIPIIMSTAVAVIVKVAGVGSCRRFPCSFSYVSVEFLCTTATDRGCDQYNEDGNSCYTNDCKYTRYFSLVGKESGCGRLVRKIESEQKKINTDPLDVALEPV